MPTKHPDHASLWVYDHPFVQDKLARARDKTTEHADFRRLLNEIAGLMCFEVGRELRTVEQTVETPVGSAPCHRLAEPLTLVAILRAGIGMLDGMLALMPEARVGHIGLYRDEKTLEPVDYYAKFPGDITDGLVLLVDPMLATGGSAVHALARLKALGCDRIRMICLVAAPEGVRRVHDSHTLMCASMRRHWTTGSTTAASSCRGWVTRVIGSSARREPVTCGTIAGTTKARRARRTNEGKTKGCGGLRARASP